jgi:hypothetical protein
MQIAHNQEEKRQKVQSCQFYFAGEAAGAAAAGAEAAGAEAAGASTGAGVAATGAAGAAGAAEGIAAAPPTGAGAAAGALMLSITPAPAEILPLLARTDRPRVAPKKMAAASAVDFDRKLEEPEAPNKLPEAPEPKAAPISAPLPCCSSTKPMIATAEMTCTTITRLNKEFMLFLK